MEDSHRPCAVCFGGFELTIISLSIRYFYNTRKMEGNETESKPTKTEAAPVEIAPRGEENRTICLCDTPDVLCELFRYIKYKHIGRYADPCLTIFGF